MSALAPAPHAGPADWIVEGVQTFGESVLSLLPKGFPAYVRVFHPAGHVVDGEWTPVRWAEIAEATGSRVDPGMQLYGLTRGRERRHGPLPGVYDQAPVVGSLPVDLAGVLADVLSRHTSTPERCWFAVWDGFGGTRDDIRSAPRFRLPERAYHLLVGAVGAATESALEPVGYQSPNLWWPDDHAWCVATEIDLDTTYVGCAGECGEEILAATMLEALPVDPATRIDRYGDPVNVSSASG